MQKNRRLIDFEKSKIFELVKLKMAIWICVQSLFINSIFFPSFLRKEALKIFGASIGKRVFIRRGVRVHFPWNLEIGDDCWIGEDVWFINHEKVRLGSNVCISQRAIICSGGHDYRSSSLAFAHEPIEIKDGAWVCLDAKVLSEIGRAHV